MVNPTTSPSSEQYDDFRDYTVEQITKATLEIPIEHRVVGFVIDTTHHRYGGITETRIYPAIEVRLQSGTDNREETHYEDTCICALGPRTGKGRAVDPHPLPMNRTHFAWTDWELEDRDYFKNEDRFRIPEDVRALRELKTRRTPANQQHFAITDGMKDYLLDDYLVEILDEDEEIATATIHTHGCDPLNADPIHKITTVMILPEDVGEQAILDLILDLEDARVLNTPLDHLENLPRLEP